MTLEQIQLVHDALVAGDVVEAANLALQADDIEERVTTRQEALTALRTLEKNLAAENNFIELAVLLWGNVRFDSRPNSVREVFDEVIRSHKLIILGASSMSKTYSCGVLFYLYWRSDPYWTAIKLAGPSEDHLYGNLFSHIVGLHKQAVIPMTDDDERMVDVNETDLFIGMHDALPEMRIQCVLCKQNQVSASGLRGHKPKPIRDVSHPRLGRMTRVYILIDEGTQVSPGAFEDIKTTEASINPATESVKIVMACNPEGTGYKIVQLAEPEAGWEVEQVDTLYHWTSKEGYRVLRLDGKKSENVIERKVIYEGMLSYEIFLGFLKSGENSGAYWAKGRGFPPLKDNAWTIVPPAWMQSQRGEPIYVGKVRNIAIVDTALQGSDKALLGIGRWGEAAGWRDIHGKVNWFVNRADPMQRRTQHVAVLDQIFQLPKTNSTVEIVQEVMGRCKQLGIQAEDSGFDKMQPVSEPVLTPSGWIPIGNIRKDDYVIGSCGKPIRVIGVYPQKDRRVFKVTFMKREWTRCGPEHLWLAHKKSRNSPEVVTTQSIFDDMLGSKNHPIRWGIPIINAPVQFEECGAPPIDPYLLGCLLGDGNLRKNGIRYASADKEIVDLIADRLPSGMKIKHVGKYDYSIFNPIYVRDENGRDFAKGRNPLLDRLRILGLAGLLSHQKFIPEYYMKSSASCRLEILQGLMDTDGFLNMQKGAKTSSSVSIGLSSKKMVNQISELVESLGGTSSLTMRKAYKKNGARAHDQHLATITLPSGMPPFKLSRKLIKYTPRPPNKYRYISSISQEPDEDSVCIRVDSPDRLYVTRHCILTHNTGNAAGVWSHAKKFWGDVLGIDFGLKASEEKVIAEDLQSAYEVYEGKVTELWFAMKRWMDPVVCAVLVNSIVQTNPLFTQVTTRRYRNVKGGRVRVEPKEEYKARNGGVSPDEADLLCMLVEFCRQRGGVTPGMNEAKDSDRGGDGERVSLESADEDDVIDRPDWVKNQIAIEE